MGSWPSDQDLRPGFHPITQVGTWPAWASGDQLCKRCAT